MVEFYKNNKVIIILKTIDDRIIQRVINLGEGGKFVIDLNEITQKMCKIDKIKRFEIYFVTWEKNFWRCSVVFFSRNKIKFNLTKKIEFIQDEKSKHVSKKMFQKKFPKMQFKL